VDHVIGQMLHEARHCQARGMTRCTVSGGPTQYPSLIAAQAAGAQFARHLHAEGFPVTNIATDRWGSKLTLTLLLPPHEASGPRTPDPAGGGKGAKNENAREDFFTLIHKGQRRELFLATITAGRLDWDDHTAAAAFGATWAGIRRMLEAHGKHEDKHFFPLLADSAPPITASMTATHNEMALTLTHLTDMIEVAVAAPTAAAGLSVYRELSAFVAQYLVHLLEEETVVMPAIWQHCGDAELARALDAFLADQSSAGIIRSRRAMLPAVSAVERRAMLAPVRVTGGQPAVDLMLDEARHLLEPAEWSRLIEDATSGG
jgi:iron-sulfur cluster repair protein YtfE (RIC family)